MGLNMLDDTSQRQVVIKTQFACMSIKLLKNPGFQAFLRNPGFWFKKRNNS